MSLNRRLKVLENGGSGNPCPECGWTPGEILRVVPQWDDDDDEREPGSVRCAGCGRYLLIDWPEFPERLVRGGGG